MLLVDESVNFNLDQKVKNKYLLIMNSIKYQYWQDGEFWLG